MSKRLNVTGHDYVKRWEPFEFGDLQLDAEVHAARKGRLTRYNGEKRVVLFTRRAEDRTQAERHPSSPDVTRLLYMNYPGQQALFIGMSVNKGMRRAGMGRQLFNYFQRNVAEEDELKFVGTGKLHKPGLALIARHSGLVPKSIDCMAEVLQPELAVDPDVPLVRILANSLPPSAMIDRSSRTLFYETAEPELMQGVPVDPDRLIALHTGWRPPLDYGQLSVRAV